MAKKSKIVQIPNTHSYRQPGDAILVGPHNYVNSVNEFYDDISIVAGNNVKVKNLPATNSIEISANGGGTALDSYVEGIKLNDNSTVLSGTLILKQGTNVKIKRNPADSNTIEISAADAKGVSAISATPKSGSGAKLTTATVTLKSGENVNIKKVNVTSSTYAFEISADSGISSLSVTPKNANTQETFTTPNVTIKPGANVNIWKNSNDELEISALGSSGQAGVQSFNNADGEISVRGGHGIKIHNDGDGEFEISSTIDDYVKYIKVGNDTIPGTVELHPGDNIDIKNNDGVIEISANTGIGGLKVYNTTSGSYEVLTGVIEIAGDNNVNVKRNLTPGTNGIEISANAITAISAPGFSSKITSPSIVLNPTKNVSIKRNDDDKTIDISSTLDFTPISDLDEISVTSADTVADLRRNFNTLLTKLTNLYNTNK